MSKGLLPTLIVVGRAKPVRWGRPTDDVEELLWVPLDTGCGVEPLRATAMMAIATAASTEIAAALTLASRTRRRCRAYAPELRGVPSSRREVAVGSSPASACGSGPECGSVAGGPGRAAAGVVRGGTADGAGW